MFPENYGRAHAWAAKYKLGEHTLGFMSILAEESYVNIKGETSV